MELRVMIVLYFRAGAKPIMGVNNTARTSNASTSSTPLQLQFDANGPVEWLQTSVSNC
jgi:hypothetical protein